MPAPIDPGDFQAAPAGAAVAPPYEATAAAVNARFTPLYAALNKAVTGLDPASIQDEIVDARLIGPQQAWQTVAFDTFLGAVTWTPANLSYYKDALGIVRFRPERFVASADFAAGAVFGNMPVGYRPGVRSYFSSPRVAASAFGSMGFSVNTNGDLIAELNFQPSSSGISFVGVEYRAES